MWIAKGEKTGIRKLEREDMEKMEGWGTHKDPLYFHYNFPHMTDQEKDEWYRLKMGRFKKKSFAIENREGHVVGFLSIRDIRWFKGDSELGIVLNPDVMNKGYGTDAIQAFLEYYFRRMKMKTITLRAAAFNERAIRCYCKCGFRALGEEEMEFEDQTAEIFYNPKYTHLKKLFTRSELGMMTTYVKMTLKNTEYEQHINSLSTKKVWKCE